MKKSILFATIVFWCVMNVKSRAGGTEVLQVEAAPTFTAVVSPFVILPAEISLSGSHAESLSAVAPQVVIVESRSIVRPASVLHSAAVLRLQALERRSRGLANQRRGLPRVRNTILRIINR